MVVPMVPMVMMIVTIVMVMVIMVVVAMSGLKAGRRCARYDPNDRGDNDTMLHKQEKFPRELRVIWLGLEQQLPTQNKRIYGSIDYETERPSLFLTSTFVGHDVATKVELIISLPRSSWDRSPEWLLRFHR